MAFNEILNVILPAFITIFIGYVLGKTVKVEISGVIDILFYVGIPALVFVSITGQDIVLLDAAKIWASVLFVSFGCGAIGWLIFRAFRKKVSALVLPMAFPNTVNLPFPIVNLAYGAAGMVAVTLYYIPGIILMYSIGIILVVGKDWKHNLKTMLKIPTVYVAVLALILNFTGVQVPSLVYNPLEFIGRMVTPTVLLTLGYSLSKVTISDVPSTIIAALVRLGLGLALGLLAVNIFGLEGVAKSVVILVSAMPSAVNTYMIAAKYKNAPELVASVVLVTTIASLVIIPFLLRIL